MYIPDLFGAYRKGRQSAIEDNWTDLKNFETVESQRNANDKAALANLQERLRFGGEQQKWANGINQDIRNNEINTINHTGNVANADMNSAYSALRHNIFFNHLGELGQATDSTYTANLNKRLLDAAALQGRNDALYEGGRAYNMGQMSGQDAYSIASGNHAINNNAVNASTQRVAESNAIHNNNMAGYDLLNQQTRNAIANQGLNQQLAQINYANSIFDGNNYINNKQALAAKQNSLTPAELGNYVSLFANGNQGDKASALYVLGQYGVTPEQVNSILQGASNLRTNAVPVVGQPIAPATPNVLGSPLLDPYIPTR